jgi:monoamine oxidase
LNHFVMNDADVIIISAGAAGLAAAQLLTEAGLRCLVIEARQRIGGRIFTEHNRFTTLPIELGAEFVHGRPKATWNLLQNANLTASLVPFDNYEVRGGRTVEAPRFSEQLNLAMSGLARLKGTRH